MSDPTFRNNTDDMNGWADTFLECNSQFMLQVTRAFAASLLSCTGSLVLMQAKF